MATIYTDLDTRPIIKRRHADTVGYIRECIRSGNRSKAFWLFQSAHLHRIHYAAALRKWRENNMVLVDGAAFINSGGNTAVAVMECR